MKTTTGPQGKWEVCSRESVLLRPESANVRGLSYSHHRDQASAVPNLEPQGRSCEEYSHLERLKLLTNIRKSSMLCSAPPSARGMWLMIRDQQLQVHVRGPQLQVDRQGPQLQLMQGDHNSGSWDRTTALAHRREEYLLKVQISSVCFRRPKFKPVSEESTPVTGILVFCPLVTLVDSGSSGCVCRSC